MSEADKKTSDQKQKDHAERIKTERHIMRSLGVTRQEARAKLDQFREQARAEDARKRTGTPESTAPPFPPAPKIESTTDTLPSKPLNQGGAEAGVVDQAIRGVLLEDDVYFDDSDATFYYINIWTDGRYEAV